MSSSQSVKRQIELKVTLLDEEGLPDLLEGIYDYPNGICMCYGADLKEMLEDLKITFKDVKMNFDS